MATKTRTIGQLREADWNPRDITPDALRGLQSSLQEFGDLSGIVVHKDGYIIAGHHRVQLLREMYGDDLKVSKVGIQTPVGTFPVRTVDWPEPMAKAANLAANNPNLQGEFTSGVNVLIQELELARPDLWDNLRLGDMEIGEPPAAETSEKEPEAGEDHPRLELQPWEHHDYILVIFDHLADWEFVCARLGIKKVDSSSVGGFKKIGLGRAIPGGKLVAVLKEGGSK